MRAIGSLSPLFLAAALLASCGSTDGGSTAGWLPDESTIPLALGQQETLTFPGMQHAAVGDPSVIKLEELLESEQVRLTAVDEGHTTMLVWPLDGSHRRAYLITVTAP